MILGYLIIPDDFLAGFPSVTREQVIESTGWRIKFADKVLETPIPTAQELKVLRALHARTKAAHGEAA